MTFAPGTTDTHTVRIRGSSEVTTIMVKGGSNIHGIAGAILHAVRLGTTRVETRSIGAGALNQAIKGCAVARLLGEREGLDLSLIPRFQSVLINGEERSTMVLAVSVRPTA